ncbi:MAG: thioredoxin family protein [Bacteroidales bacterium]|nr:thioredoxin family protein [Bacteroidales bacterium]MBN2757565.1 thioredoxin family protein [Bacteroidales bacterium]
MTLQTDLKHLVTVEDFNELINNNENVMVSCGRMGPMCVPVYDIMEDIIDEGEYKHVEFRDMLFDNPNAGVIRNLSECKGFMGLPFTVYFKNGKVVKATSSIQNRDQITDILKSEFGK